MQYRTERDALGLRKIPSGAYYGAFTSRALENFKISGSKPSPALVKALSQVKIASARANMKLGLLEAKKGNAIIRAAKEFGAGKFAPCFALDYFQAGAGTPYNMNANEIIANRATELLGGKRGQYLVSPNNDVNMSQSSNDVIPTAVRLTLLMESKELLSELQKTKIAFHKKAVQFKGILKCGRTHYMDAVPLTLGQEFASYEALIGSAIERLECSLEGLKEIPLGGTAVGTGITTHPNYRKAVIAALSKESGFKFSAPKDNFELMHSMNAFVDYSNALRCLAISLHKTCNDLMFLSSGPKAGIAEIILPEVEPGSSIMPGKVNPSISEAVKMSCFYVEGLDAAVAGAAKEGHLEINVYTPVILFSLEQATGILSSSLKMFSSKCISGIKADKKRCSELLFSSYSYATALNPYLGYAAVAELIKEALHRKISIEQLILEKGFISKADLARMLSVSAMAKPCRSDLKLKKKISRDKKFIAFLKSIR